MHAIMSDTGLASVVAPDALDREGGGMRGGVLISRAATLIEAGIGEDMFALDVDGGHCLSFNATAAHVWQALETPQTMDALCASLIQSYAIDTATCRAEVTALIDSLAAERLVTLTPQ